MADKTTKTRKAKPLSLAAVLLAAVAWGITQLAGGKTADAGDQPRASEPSAAQPAQKAPEQTTATNDGGAQRIVDAFRRRLSGVQVEVSGTVRALLADDNEGSRHQRFILELHGGHTLLVAHNIDLAPRVAGIAQGDRVEIAGQYEWSDQGGVLHWTHHDPRGQHAEGWIKHGGRTYK
jgi:hypothetical protein